MDTVTREFRKCRITFRAVTVGFLKNNPDLMSKVQKPSRTLAELVDCLLFVQEATDGIATHKPSDDQPKLSDLQYLLDMDELGPAVNAALEASGFTFAPLPGTPGEAAPAK